MAVQQNLIDQLATSALADWTEVAGGSSRVGIQINSTGNSLHYTRSDLDIDNQKAFQIEAVVSGSVLGADGELGARMWVKFRDAVMPPTVHRFVELRLERQAGAYQINLVDGTSGIAMASLAKDWTTFAPRFRIRIKRQEVGGTDYIFLQSEPSSGWDDPAQPNNLNDANSIAVPLSTFGIVSTVREIGFGNVIAGSYYSEWESIHLTVGSDLLTILPYWPPAAPNTGGSIDVADSDLTVSDTPRIINVDAVLPGYLNNDVVRTTLNRVPYGGSPPPTDDTKADVSDPSSGPQAWAFTNVADDQTVTAKLEMIEISGRTTQPSGGGVGYAIPDRTSPADEITAEVGAGTGFNPLGTCYNAGNIPTAIAVEVAEAHIDTAASTLEIGTSSQTLAALSTADQTGVPAGKVRYAWTGVGALFTTDVATYAVKATLVDLEGNPQGGPPVEVNDSFSVNKSVPSGSLVVSTNVGAPDFGSFAPFSAATVYGECLVGVRIDDATWQDLDWDDGSLPGPWDSQAVIGGTPETLSVGTFYDFTDPGPGTDHIIARMATLVAPATVQFHLEDRCDNTVDVPGAAANVNVDSGDPVGVITVQEQGPPVGTFDPPAATYPPGDVKIGVEVTEPNFDETNSRLVVLEDGVPIQDLAFNDPTVTPPGARYEFPAITLQAGRSYQVDANLVDTATNAATESASFVAGKPFFEIPGSQTNNPDAVTVSHTSPNNEPSELDPSGLMLTGSTNDNYIGVVVTNSGAIDGTCKYRHFMVPACLFTATANWKLITTGTPKEVDVPAGSSARSQGNVNYNHAHPEFPNPGDPLWALVSGDILHTCTAVVLHSSEDPLELPNGGGSTAPIPDSDFDNEANFRTNVMVVLATYGGSPNGYWQAVTSNPKILNRNINIQNVGA